MQNNISEEDLVRIFSYKERTEKRHCFVFGTIYKLILFAFIVGISYLIINSGAIWEKIDFWYKNDFKTVTSSEEEVNVPVAPGVPNLEAEKRNTPTLIDNQIGIPVLDVKAPVLFRVNNNAKETAAALENGVIHINGTALPGEKGNVYITGHSSNYVWSKGQYNSVFALLDKLVVGDMVYIKFNNVTYEYKVFDKKTVSPTDVSVLKQTNDSRLTLVTCWPVGTSLKRLVVLADQIYPDPSKNPLSNETIETNKLPSGR
jgi:LPXTG-site transpeptidase (sortase) family protein